MIFARWLCCQKGHVYFSVFGWPLCLLCCRVTWGPVIVLAFCMWNWSEVLIVYIFVTLHCATGRRLVLGVLCSSGVRVCSRCIETVTCSSFFLLLLVFYFFLFYIYIYIYTHTHTHTHMFSWSIHLSWLCYCELCFGWLTPVCKIPFAGTWRLKGLRADLVPVLGKPSEHAAQWGRQPEGSVPSFVRYRIQ